MLFFTYVAFLILSAVCIGLQYVVIKNRHDPAVGNNPQFLQFQKSYFMAYFPALLADWLQGPYLYKLYTHYGFQEDQIAVLYVVGFASSVILGTWAPIAADRFGRKKLCIFFTVTYSLSCLFKLSRSYGILLIARVLSGVATSLLFSSFEAWYVYEHVESHDFPKEWIGVTFNKASVWNGVLAVIAGIVANMCAEWFNLGPVSPSVLAIPCLILTAVIVFSNWNENYSMQKTSLKKSFSGALKVIVTEPKVFLIGSIQSLFESVMYIFVFIWTPVLDPILKANPGSPIVRDKDVPSLGIIFSSFMVCVLIGSAAYQLLLKVKHMTVPYVLACAVGLATLASILCIFSTHPDNSAKNLALIAFLCFEVAVGMYFPSMTYLSVKILPEANRRSITNLFRAPLNLIACVVLMMLHNASFRHGNRLIFVTCTALLLLCGLLAGKLVAMVKEDSESIKMTFSTESKDSSADISNA